jgi:hypothetical protein
MTTTQTAGTTDRDIREQKAHVEQYRRLLESAEKELQRMLTEAGRRPGDGSDQPELFQRDAQGELSWSSE